MTVRMRHTRSHTGNRRSHHALQAISLTQCANCGFKIRLHAMCVNCGQYAGRQVVDVLKKLTKKEKKKKEKELRDQEENSAREKPLDAAALSKK